jgi:dethiobiotin synthetase
MLARILHVVGTDTGVGKTAVACALARALRRRGFDVGACKPFASGEDPAGVPSDARLLVEASGSRDAPELVAPVRFRTPASPWAAAREEGRGPGIEAAGRALETLAGRHGILVVEGIGGVAVPLAEGWTYLDFLAGHPGRAVVVARAGLGTLNHTLLTLEALRTRGIPAAGVILNRPSPGSDPSERLNPEAIEAFGRTRVLASLPHFDLHPDSPSSDMRLGETLDALTPFL